jgi:uncharacterized membrane protein YcaP (DUF421 family)
MIFNGWSSIERLLLVGVPAYVALLLMLRISGKRTLSKFNAFDLIVTVAFGSMLAAGFLNTDLALVDVLGGFALLVLLQFVITWSSVRSDRVDNLVKAEPQLLFHRGEFLRGPMKRERVTESEVLAAIRSQGHATTTAVGAVVLETDGTITVVSGGDGPADAMTTVRGHQRGGHGI